MRPEEKQPDKIKAETSLKKPYNTPGLVIHGTVAKITKAQGTKGSDGLTGSEI